MRYLFAASLAALAVGALGCSFGLRSPEMYKKDVRALLESRSGEIKACYDGVIKGNKESVGNVLIHFDVQEDSGSIVNMKVDDKSTAPVPVRDCVNNSLQGLVLKPGDSNPAKATFTYEFEIAPQAAPPSA